MHQASPVDETILHCLDESNLDMGALRTDFIEEILSGEVPEVQSSEQAMKGDPNVADVMAELEKERRKNFELLGRVSSLEAKLGCEESNSEHILEHADVEQVDAEPTLKSRKSLREDILDAGAVSSGSHLLSPRAHANARTGNDTLGGIRTGHASYESMVNWMCREDVSRADIEKLNDAGSGDDDDDDDNTSEHGDSGRTQREKDKADDLGKEFSTRVPDSDDSDGEEINPEDQRRQGEGRKTPLGKRIYWSKRYGYGPYPVGYRGAGILSSYKKTPKIALCPMENISRYVRQRMGRNKLKSFGPLMCQMALLVHVRTGSFFFKALGITLLFMAGFSDDQVRKETKYRNLALLRKYYRSDESAKEEQLFHPFPAFFPPALQLPSTPQAMTGAAPSQVHLSTTVPQTAPLVKKPPPLLVRKDPTPVPLLVSAKPKPSADRLYRRIPPIPFHLMKPPKRGRKPKNAENPKRTPLGPPPFGPFPRYPPMGFPSMPPPGWRPEQRWAPPGPFPFPFPMFPPNAQPGSSNPPPPFYPPPYVFPPFMMPPPSSTAQQDLKQPEEEAHRSRDWQSSEELESCH